jgi:RNA recognition motif-containing protein
MVKKLFVGGLSWDTTDATLNDFFAKVGSVQSAAVIIDKFSGKSKGFGFVEMATEDEAQQAIQQLNGQALDGRNITVSEAKPQQPRENRYSGGSSFGGRNDRDRDRRGGRSY